MAAKPASTASLAVGTFKTAPAPTANAPIRFAFSGDADATPGPNGKPGFNNFETYGQMAREKNDFNINLGDTIYENASNVAGNNGASWLNSPSVTLSGSSASLNGVPTFTGFATAALPLVALLLAGI